MTLQRYYRPSVRLDFEELDGLLKILDALIEEFEGEQEATVYYGARLALSIVRYHEYVEFPADFMKIFDHYMNDGGVSVDG